MKPLLLLCALCCCTPAWTAPHLLPQSSEALDQQLSATLQSLSQGKLPEARVLARQTASLFPQSALAQLLAAELSASAAHHEVLASTDVAQHSQKLQGLLQEARARLHERPSPTDNPFPLPDELPTEVVQLGTAISALLAVDLANSSLHHLAVNAGVSTLIQQHYIGSGKAGYDKRVEGDNKTPLGIYRINGYRSDASLPDLYGAGALTLNYPNALDRYLGRTGSGIWLHGVPHDQRNRSPRSSEGCVTMSNDHFRILYRRLSGDLNVRRPHTTLPSPSAGPFVLLTHDIQWRDAASRQSEQLEFQSLFERYQQAWHERNLSKLQDLYVSHSQVNQQLHSLERVDSSLLDAVNRQDISIFHNPSQTGTDTNAPAKVANATKPDSTNSPDEGFASRPQIVMYMQMGESNEYQLTLYWGKNLQGQWQLLTEHWTSYNS